ncbi:hypothetical protein HWC29_gp075 [Aeromonas phage 4_4572]|uniref:Uncharacterized protein n=1 Tax=Aeromonas phage 4_4572 TaxID=2588517 RepID=A0A5B9NCC3_9CAUD|nr:hypothetical protein HWC29_gp075 [Aeromonas phage 4_4572]QEG09111.1 hypothetical protein [Aeromonas phage 4_4572]
MNIIELPSGGEFIRLNWNRSKFTGIIPVSSTTSTLHYDGMVLNLTISASDFNRMMDEQESSDSQAEFLNNVMQNYSLTGEFYTELNTSEMSHLQHTSWKTEISKVTTPKSGVKVWCSTLVISSFLINQKGTQVTKTVQFIKRHVIDKCKSYETMKGFLLETLHEDIKSVTPTYDYKQRWNHHQDRREFPAFWAFEIKGIIIPIYDSAYVYKSSSVHGAALAVELSRYGNVAQFDNALRQVEVQAHARLQAARIIAMGPHICKLLQNSAHLREYAKVAMSFNRETYLQRAESAQRSAEFLLKG